MKVIKTIFWIIVMLLAIVLVLGMFKFNFTNDDIYNENGTQVNIHDATYIINGEKVTLKNGISEIATIPNSASKITTRYFGNDVKADFDKDGTEDTAFILTQNTGGSGTFYYVVALLNTVNGLFGTEGLLLGDRIAPQSTTLGKDGVFVVNYADRKTGEDFSVPPMENKSLWLLLDTKTMKFGEVAQNIETETDPSKMTLVMKPWSWLNTVYSNDTEVKPKVDGKFTLTFKNDKTFSATTDCNNVGGQYIVTGNKISFDKIFSTKMYCKDSQENDFIKMLGQTQNYLFTSKGELVLGLKVDSGSIFFK